MPDVSVDDFIKYFSRLSLELSNIKDFVSIHADVKCNLCENSKNDACLSGAGVRTQVGFFH